MARDQVSWEKINIKQEDLTPIQIRTASEINEHIQTVEKFEQEAYVSDSPIRLAEIIMVMAVIHSRIGFLLADLEYAHTKIIDEGECKETAKWEELQEKKLSATACRSLAEAVYTPELRKRKRIARWLWEKAKYYYTSIERMIYSTNRKHDDLKPQFGTAKFQT